MYLEKLFTGSATAKILDLLWECQDKELTLTEIADKAGIHYTTLMKALPQLQRLGMVTMTRQVGNAKLYRINKEDVMVKRLIKFQDELNVRLKENHEIKQDIPVPVIPVPALSAPIKSVQERPVPEQPAPEQPLPVKQAHKPPVHKQPARKPPASEPSAAEQPVPKQTRIIIQRSPRPGLEVRKRSNSNKS